MRLTGAIRPITVNCIRWIISPISTTFGRQVALTKPKTECQSVAGNFLSKTGTHIFFFFQRESPLICGVNFFLRLCPFSTPSLIILGVGLPAYLSNHNPFSREHSLVGFNKFLSLVCWCIVIHHHWPQGPTFFRRVRWDFMCVQCDV